MRLNDFLVLRTEKQYEEFWEYCKFIEHHIDAEKVKHHLYAVHNFYVELTSDLHGNLNPCIHAFTDGARLEKYMKTDIDYIRKILRDNSAGNR